MTLTSSEDPVAVCPDKTVFTAHVVLIPNICPGSLIPTGGTVQFVDTTTSTSLGTGTLVNGYATSPPVCFTSTGVHDIEATYTPGAAPFVATNSAEYAQCVTLYDTTTVLTIAPSDNGQGYILTATVSVPAGQTFP